jgi:DNA processing protein
MAMDIRSLLIVSRVPGVGPNRLRSLVNHFQDPRRIFEAAPRQLVTVEGIERKTALSIVSFFRGNGPTEARRFAEDQLSRLNRVGGRIVTFWERDYPSNLRRIYDPPPFLFVRGRFLDADATSIALVGTRNPSGYGTQMAERLSTELARLGLTVISGLARGIDTTAHSATLKAHGRTVAVIGSGVDIIYPPENRQLSEHIITEGAVVSEYLMGTKPDAGNFPRRNRIISGIALATVIIETGVDGGAMITAATALDQNRDIFAIPSAANGKRKSGTNQLIKEGRAMLAESVDDIIAELAPKLKPVLTNHPAARSSPPPDLTLFERHLLDVMTDDPIHIDMLAERAGVATADALVHLLSLEFKGMIRQSPGKMFVKL